MSAAASPGRHLLAALVLIAVGAGLGWLLARPEPAPAAVYLDAERLLRSEGTDYPFTAARASSSTGMTNSAKRSADSCAPPEWSHYACRSEVPT